MRVIVLYKTTNLVIVRGFTRRIWPNKTLQSYNATAVTGFVRRAKKTKAQNSSKKTRNVLQYKEQVYACKSTEKKG